MTKISKVTLQDNREEIFSFLEMLRETGKTNMFGATPYLEKHLKMNRHDAKDALIAWMDSYRG